MATYIGGDIEFEAHADDPSGRLDELRVMIKNATCEARCIVNRVPVERYGAAMLGRANSYWIPSILMALDNNHDWIGSCMCTMQETIDDLDELNRDVCLTEDDEND